MVSEGSMGGSEVGRVIEGVEGGAERYGVGSKVSGTDEVCLEFVVSWSGAKVGEEGSRISG